MEVALFCILWESLTYTALVLKLMLASERHNFNNMHVRDLMLVPVLVCLLTNTMIEINFGIFEPTKVSYSTLANREYSSAYHITVSRI